MKVKLAVLFQRYAHAFELGTFTLLVIWLPYHFSLFQHEGKRDLSKG